jgi:hypothetical protein
MNTPKVAQIKIVVVRCGSFLNAAAFDEADRFRGDVTSPDQADVDEYIEHWREHANEVVVIASAEQALASL